MLGLTFKAGTDDLRESPALAVVERLLENGAIVTAYDPLVNVPPLAGVQLVSSALEATKKASVVVVLTEWPEFGKISLDELAAAMSGKEVVDTRGLFSASDCVAAGLNLHSVGKN